MKQLNADLFQKSQLLPQIHKIDFEVFLNL